MTKEEIENKADRILNERFHKGDIDRFVKKCLKADICPLCGDMTSLEKTRYWCIQICRTCNVEWPEGYYTQEALDNRIEEIKVLRRDIKCFTS